MHQARALMEKLEKHQKTNIKLDANDDGIKYAKLVFNDKI